MGLCTSKPSPSPDLSSSRSHAQQNPSNDAIRGNDGAGPAASANGEKGNPSADGPDKEGKLENGKKSPFFPFYSPSPAHYFFSKKSSPARSPAPGNASANSTPMRLFRRPFPPPSPAKHIRAALALRRGTVKRDEAAIPEGGEGEGPTRGLDKSFGFSKNFGSKYELGEEVGRGHFGYTCIAKPKKGELKGQRLAVKVIPKQKVCRLHATSYHYRFL